jgi:hypothetical protein
MPPAWWASTRSHRCTRTWTWPIPWGWGTRRCCRGAEPLAEEPESPGEELLEVFLEESSDIVESAAAALARWQADPRSSVEVDNLMRDLHTLKGVARMVEIAPIGDLAHELEFLYELLAAGRLPPSAPLFACCRTATTGWRTCSMPCAWGSRCMPPRR